MKSGQNKKKTTASERAKSSRKGGGSGTRADGKRGEKKGRRQSDFLFANIIEKMNEGFVALDANMNYVYINEKGRELLNRKAEELIGRNYWAEYPQDKDTPFGKAYLQALETQTPIQMEEYYAPSDRWIENRIYPAANGLSIFFNDITERKRAEAALHDSEDRFQTLANGSAVLLWVNGLEGCEFVNREYLEFLGVGEVTDVRGYDWSGFVHPDDRESYIASYQHAFDARSPFNAEFRFLRHDGEYRWMRSEATPRHAEDGAFLGYVGASIDITERRRAEEALLQKDEQLRRVTDITPTLFSQCSRDLRYVFVNRATADFLGRPAEEIVGKPMLEILGEQVFDAILPYIAQVLDGQRVEYELEIPYPAAGKRFMHAVYVPEVDRAGKVTGWLATLTDITERKRIEDERIRLLVSEQQQRFDADHARVEAERARAETEQELQKRKMAEQALGAWTETPLPQEGRSVWLRYGVALAVTVALVLLRLVLNPLLGDSVPYTLPLGGVAFTVWYAGVGPAVLSLICGYVGVLWLILDWELMRAPNAADVTSLGLYLFTGALMIALGRAMSRAQQQAHRSARVAVERQRQSESHLLAQKRVEEALRESERKFSLIYDKLPFVATLARPEDGALVDVNEEFETLFGYGKQEIIGRDLFEVGFRIRPEEREDLLATLNVQGAVHDLELPAYSHAMGERFFLLNLDLVNVQGVRYILLTAKDSTERKQAEEALRASEARLVLLAGISELIRKAEDQNELLYAVSTALGKHLKVRRCLFNETDVENDLEIVHRDYYDGVESVAGVHTVSEYSSSTSAEMQAGKTVVNFDSKVDPRTAADYERTYEPARERAYIAVPMLRENRWIASLWVSDDVPRQWSPEEISLVETVAERTWATVEKLRIDAELRSSELRLRLATQAAQMFTWELDIPNQVSRVADTFADALGFSADLIPADNSEILQRFIHPEDGAVILEALGNAIQNKKDLRSVQYRIVHPLTGQPIWLEVNGMIQYDSAGNPSQMFGVGQNISERKQAEEDLRQLEERFSKAFHTSPAFKIIVRADNERIVDINETNAATFEYTRAEALGRPRDQILQFANQEESAALFADLQAHGSIANREATVRTPSGEVRSIIFSSHPVSLGGENHFLYTILDITERKQAEEALRQLNLELEGRVQRRTAQLQGANQALEESHRRLQAVSQRLVEVQEEERRAIARELHDRVGQSLSALNLNLAIINSQLSAFVNEDVNARLSDCIHLVADVISLVRDVMADLRPPVLDDFGLEAALQMYLDEFKSRYFVATQFDRGNAPLPRLGASIEMTLLRIVQECLLNVARHARAEKVALSLQLEGNIVRLIIEDDGIGMQSLPVANRAGGHGLMIMRERAEAVSGNLLVSSMPGKGTQIEVRIPLHTNILTGNSS